ncbi:MAG: tRNA (guanosine(46)-N7)-methyltransferase TrmB [Prevotellaceae bacterium]|jgi:tRNA (guanine-N7-)-methyltransferase|nr:tRNA (guanosine(46)-N7)-methyltransferase TrmB [Prevotellaceae bacterium]
MGKDKLKRFRENLMFAHLFQPQRDESITGNQEFKGLWHEKFGNANPLILELGCGRGEYTVGLSRRFPQNNFIGIDVKGARLWKGAKTVEEENITNAAFLRIRIEFIDNFFAKDEVDEIWITFPDPQIKKPRKRLTSPLFLERYGKFLKKGGIIHLKTDSRLLYDYTLDVINAHKLPLLESCPDVHKQYQHNELLNIKTFYETQFISQGLPITYIKWQNESVNINDSINS